jgi:VanZ family protein
MPFEPIISARYRITGAPQGQAVRWMAVVAYALLIYVLSAQSQVPATLASLHLSDSVAHMLEYAGFGALLFHAVSHSGRRYLVRHALTCAILFAILYGMTDEIHQSFVPFRDPSLRDLFSDAFGAVMGTLAVRFSK